jgi:hypothetical protein
MIDSFDPSTDELWHFRRTHEPAQFSFRCTGAREALDCERLMRSSTNIGVLDDWNGAALGHLTKKQEPVRQSSAMRAQLRFINRSFA